MTKIFFDTEFTELTRDAKLLSLGMVSESGERFYAEISGIHRKDLNPWVLENVVPNLKFWDRDGCSWDDGNPTTLEVFGPKEKVADFVLKWLSPFGEVEMWADVLAWDWLLFCDLWEGSFGMPKNIFYIPFDIATLFREKGLDPDISREEFAGMKDGPKHNALWDARVCRECYRKLYTKPYIFGHTPKAETGPDAEYKFDMPAIRGMNCGDGNDWSKPSDVPFPCWLRGREDEPSMLVVTVNQDGLGTTLDFYPWVSLVRARWAEKADIPWAAMKPCRIQD